MKIIKQHDGQECFHRICPYCKEQVSIYRGSNKNIFFNNQVYHIDCFLKIKQVHKKCKNCKNTFSFTTAINEEMIYYQNAFYCKNCFLRLCEQGIEKKSRKWKNAYENLDKYILTAKTMINKSIQERNIAENQIDLYVHALNDYAAKVFAEHDIDDILKNIYGIEQVGVFYQRYLRPLYDGTSEKYHNIQIPAIHLLEMWNTKLPYFGRLYQKNIKLGKSFTHTQRAAYDLSILINKYEDFLSWKKKQAIHEQDVDTNKSNDNHVNLFNQVTNTHAQHVDYKDDEIMNVLDDIFG